MFHMPTIRFRRRFGVNLQTKRFYLPEQKRWIKLRVTANTIKTINKKGIEEVLRQARKQGISV